MNEFLNETNYNAPLMKSQTFMFDYQLNFPKSTMFNIYIFNKWSLAIDEKLFSQAVVCAIQAHPIFNSVFYFTEDGDLWQKKLVDEPIELAIEYVSEAELEIIKTTLLQPFILTNNKLYRCRLFKTEAALYLFFDSHHAIADGISRHIFLNDISKAYRGQNVPAERYSYYHAIWDEFDMMEKYKDFDGRQYYDTLLQGWNGQALPKLDGVIENFLLGDNFMVLDLTVKELTPSLKRFSIDENVFFMTVMALTNAVYNNDMDDLVFTWVHNGRTSLKQSKLIGLMIKEHLVRVRINREMTIEELFDRVKEAKEQSMEDTFYPYYEYLSLDSKHEISCFMFQGNIKNRFNICGECFEMEELPNTDESTQSTWDVEVAVEDGKYTLLLEYCLGLYKEESASRWVALFQAVAKRLMNADTVKEINQSYE